MEELFRFSMSRPPSTTSATTINLERRTPFQQALEVVRPNWSLLQNLALEYIRDNVASIINPPQIAQLLTTKNFGLQLEKILPAEWPDFVINNRQGFTINEFNPLIDHLSNLFVAYVLIRCEDLNWLNDKIETMGFSIEVAEFLRSGQPSLNELAELLRLIHLGFSDLSLVQTPEAINLILNKTFSLPVKIFGHFKKPVIPVGVADLLVVKQHIYRYEAGEISRIENILKGEERKHSQKHTLSNEKETFLHTETERQTEQELSITDHVSLKNEIETTLKEDTKIDAGTEFKISGAGYEFGANVNVSYDKSTTEARKSATEIAKDVIQKTTKRITQKIIQNERSKITEIFEELEEQGFKGGNEHISGIYQWLNKVYLAQVFNFGKRLQFDLMVPEPGALLRNAAKLESKEISDLQEPPPFNISPTLLTDLAGPNNYAGFVALYNVTGVEPPPPEFKYIEKPFGKSPIPDGDTTLAETIQVEDGYKAKDFSISVAYENHGDGAAVPQLDIMIGNAPLTINEANANDKGGHNRSFYQDFTNLNALGEGNVGLGIKTNWITGFAGNIRIKCQITDRLFTQWQLQAYEKIAARREKLYLDYIEDLAGLKLAQKVSSPLGSDNETINRLIERAELKRSCISIINNSDVAGFNDVEDDSGLPPQPPHVDIMFKNREANSPTVRFFEHAFEWEKMGYVFYPYFWARGDQWKDLLFLKSDDLLFENFLRAGYARVVLPVRKGFEDAINFFLQTGKPWLGGSLPKIGDKTYLPITEEMKELTGAPGDEKPEGEPWEVRIPTRLIKLRKDDELPKWKLDNVPNLPKSTGSWNWIED